ncbi:PAS domain-containing protein [Limimaricola sp.]|uniref:PAS domain-containing protein n=1 Tax=Limimaricola sp. TaxID=2211665 RepID=UPI004057FB4A
MTMRNEQVRIASDAASRMAQFETYWRGLVRHARPPARGQIEPGRIGEALPGAFVIDRIAPGQARMRVAGQSLCELVGGEARGLPLSRLFTPNARARLADLLEHGFGAHLPLHAPLQVQGRAAGRLLLLPLQPEPGAAPQMIGALLHDLPPGRARRFGFAGPVRIGAPPAAAPRLRLVVDNGVRLLPA